MRQCAASSGPVVVPGGRTLAPGTASAAVTRTPRPANASASAAQRELPVAALAIAGACGPGAAHAPSSTATPASAPRVAFLVFTVNSSTAGEAGRAFQVAGAAIARHLRVGTQRAAA